MTKRVVEEGPTRIAGEGADGNLYGVTTITSNGGKGTYRRKPCPTCPWRTDAEIGRFPPQAYRESANTSYDAAFNTFACHESGKDKPATCAGFLLANANHNIGVRLAVSFGKLDLEQVSAEGIELYDSYKAMAVANGVDPDDPVLADCRGNFEEPAYLRRRRKPSD